MTNQSLSCIEENLWPRGERRDIWMIMDGARDRTIFPILLECRLQYSCLYSGFLPPALEIAAPYLVQLEYQDKYTRRILERAWGNSWGIFLKCDLNLDQLRRHLRQFLVVRDPRGSRLVFRYYDPRVLRVYLPTCLQEELRNVFGPIQVFWTEGHVPGDMLKFHFERGNLVRRTLALDARRTPEPSQPESGQSLDAETLQRRATLTMRETQLSAFSRIEVQKFKEWMLAHLKKFFPTEYQSAGETQLREIIQYGIKRAASYGITSRRDVCKYIDLMVVFGRNFDTETRFRWAGEILGKDGNPDAKMRSLFQEAKSHLSEG
jgi:hypothetical protein